MDELSNALGTYDLYSKTEKLVGLDRSGAEAKCALALAALF
jgi:hypothetical protein